MVAMSSRKLSILASVMYGAKPSIIFPPPGARVNIWNAAGARASPSPMATIARSGQRRRAVTAAVAGAVPAVAGAPGPPRSRSRGPSTSSTSTPAMPARARRTTSHTGASKPSSSTTAVAEGAMSWAAGPATSPPGSGVPALAPAGVVTAAPPGAAGAVVPVVPPTAGAAAAPPAGTKAPSRCHRPVKLLNGPPTIWLVQVSEKDPSARIVPVGAVVLPGREPSGFGEPWLNAWSFHVAAKARRSPERPPPSARSVGGSTRAPVWRSVGFVDPEKSTPKNRTGRITRTARLLPAASKPGLGAGWNPPVTSPPSVPGARGVTVRSAQVESALSTQGPWRDPVGRIIRKYDPVPPPAPQLPAAMRKVPTSSPSVWAADAPEGWASATRGSQSPISTATMAARRRRRSTCMGRRVPT